MSDMEMGAPDGAEPSAPVADSTDWQAEYCRVFAELQGAYGEISSLRRQLADYQQAYARTFDRLRDIETDDSRAFGRGEVA